MSRWTAYLIAAAAVAGAFSLFAVAPAAAAPAAGAHARGPVASSSYGARPVHRARPPGLAPRPHARSGGHGARPNGRWQSHHGGWHGRFGRPEHHRYGHHGRRNMLGYGAAGWNSVFDQPVAVYNTGYAEPPLQWTYAEPDLAPCVRPLIIQIGAPVYGRPLPQVRYGGVGCGTPQVARYVVGRAGPRVLDVTAEPSGRGKALRARH